MSNNNDAKENANDNNDQTLTRTPGPEQPQTQAQPQAQAPANDLQAEVARLRARVEQLERDNLTAHFNVGYLYGMILLINAELQRDGFDLEDGAAWGR